MAQALLKKREGEITDGKILSVKFEKITLKDLAKLFFTDYEFHQRKSLGRAQISVNHLKEFFGEYTPVPRISTSAIKEYIQYRKKTEGQERHNQQGTGCTKKDVLPRLEGRSSFGTPRPLYPDA